MVFAESHRGHADCPHHARCQIGPAAHVVVHIPGQGVEEEPVDREVAALSVFGRGRESDAGGVAAVGVGGVRPKCRHLDLPSPLRPEHGDHAEGSPHGEGPPATKHLPHLVGPGRRRHVVIGGNSAQKLVPHAAAGPQRFVAGSPQAADNVDGKLPRLLGVGKRFGHLGAGS